MINVKDITTSYLGTAKTAFELNDTQLEKHSGGDKSGNTDCNSIETVDHSGCNGCEGTQGGIKNINYLIQIKCILLYILLLFTKPTTSQC